ncbi:MAG: adenylate/guanylate cyclase domain-containing protein [Candidatus Hodarchaeota archaeon]
MTNLSLLSRVKTDLGNIGRVTRPLYRFIWLIRPSKGFCLSDLALLGAKMRCPSCQFENREGVKFCEKCGSKLELTCPACGAKIPLDRLFCGECGHSLALPSQPPAKELSFDEKLAKIQRYLPKGLTEKILSQRDRIEGERKQVTVMFADMEGFTSLSEKLGAEEAYAFMDQVYEILIHRVHDYEGTVNEMTGDGIMALFGAPIALEDAPQRAIRSAHAIHREMARLSDKLKQEKVIPPIKMRIGIHTGPVVVGTLGNDLRLEFKAVGDTVNLASRVQDLAEPASTYVTEDTFKLTEGLFRFEALGEKQVKGREEPVGFYRVIAPHTRRTRFDVSAERGLTPFVGRERELELLLDGFQRSKEGRGQAVSIVAEAGVGKSRLLYEFRKGIANEDVTFIEGRCLSYSRSVAYHPVIDTLKSNFDIREGDGDSEIKEKVKRGLKTVGVDEASTLPYLLELLSVKDSGIDKIPMSPEARKDRIIEALNRNVLKGSEIRPVVMAVEDLHWMDKSSEERFKSLLDSISGARVFLIFTYRPEFVPTWGGKSYHSQITLNRLSNRESLAIVAHLLGTEDIAQDLEELILEKTEGVPFFIEEFVKSLKDLKVIEKANGRLCLTKETQAMTIPSTIQDVIMARVDSLPEGAKEVLQTGSVIEREFSYELIRHVTGIPEKELLANLSTLKDSELLYERGIYPQAIYVFKHALTQEVVYDSILSNRKKKLHERIGNASEDFYKDNLDEYFVILGEHFIKGENFEKGAEYSRLASKKFEKTASLNDAIAYAKKRVACLERLPQTYDVQEKIIDARSTLGLYIAQMTYFIDAKDAIVPIIDLALTRTKKGRLAQIYTIMGTYNYMVEEDFPNAFKHLEEAIKISEEANDTISLLLASYWLGVALSWNCEFDNAVYYLKKALDIGVDANSLWGISSLKSNLAHFGYYFRGKLNIAYQTSDEALRLAEESGDIYSKSIAYTVHGISCYGKRFLAEATKHLLKGADFCERIKLFSYNALAQSFLGDTYFEIGEYQKAKDHYGKAISLMEKNRFAPYWRNFYKVGLARAKVMNNEKDIDLEALYRHVDEIKVKLVSAMAQRYIAQILLNIDEGHLSDAENWVKKAIDSAGKTGMMFDLGQDYAFYTEIFKKRGDKAKARESLAKGVEILKECGADGWVEKYEKELAAIS